MANVQFDNTYYVDTASAQPLQWNSGSVVSTVVFYAIDTTAVAQFVLAGSNPLALTNTATVVRFSVLTQGAGTSIMPATQTIDLGRTRFSTAWIPTVMTACTAWINFV